MVGKPVSLPHLNNIRLNYPAKPATKAHVVNEMFENTFLLFFYKGLLETSL